MVKINLLPSYIFEKGRILLTLVVFVVLLGVVGGVLYRAKTDIEDIEKKYKEDTPKFATAKTIITTAEAAAKDWESKSGTYTSFIDFFTGTTVQPHNAKLKKLLAEAPAKFRAPGQGWLWFNEMSIEGKKVTAKGHIKGLSNYVSYFFAMRDKNVTVTTTAPTIKNDRPTTYAQEFDVEVSTDLSEELPTTAPTGPSDAKDWSDLYAPGSGGAAAAPGATPPAK